MKLRNHINISLMGLIGSVLLVVSEFFSWFSNYSLIELFIITSSVAIEDSFLFLFPIISGIVCLIANILVMYKFEYRIKSVIMSLVGLGFLLIFFFDYISQELEYLSNAGIGLYLGVTGFLLNLFNPITILMTKDKILDGN